MQQEVHLEKPARVQRSRILHSGRVFQLVRENVMLQNGVAAEVDIIRHPGAAAIVAFNDAQHILVLRQYRHSIGKFIWEIPAGTLSAGESPLGCAQRELTEETGFAGNSWHSLGSITPVPGYSNEYVHLFLATDLVPASAELDADEILQVHSLPFEEALAMVRRGDIQDAKTLCGLWKAWLWIQSQEESATA